MADKLRHVCMKPWILNPSVIIAVVRFACLSVDETSG
jgi:hypothetical protein